MRATGRFFAAFFLTLRPLPFEARAAARSDCRLRHVTNSSSNPRRRSSSPENMHASSKRLSDFLGTGSQRTTIPSHLISSFDPCPPGSCGSTIVSATFDSGARKLGEVQYTPLAEMF